MAHLARALATLRVEINDRWPDRKKAADGWIGDVKHQRRKSDHNPDPFPKGVVRAIDVDKNGIDVMLLVRAAIACPLTEYVIYNHVIYSRKYGFAARRYKGSNPHTGHAHISLRRGSKYENDRRPWLAGAGGLASEETPMPPTLQQGATGAVVKRAKGLLLAAGHTTIKVGPDGLDPRFGPAMKTEVEAYQRNTGLEVDGVIGPKTWSFLIEGPR